MSDEHGPVSRIYLARHGRTVGVASTTVSTGSKVETPLTMISRISAEAITAWNTRRTG